MCDNASHRLDAVEVVGFCRKAQTDTAVGGDATQADVLRADFDADALLDQIYVDREELSETVRGALRARDQVGLDQVVAAQPLRQGLAELVGYLSLSDPAFVVVFDGAEREQITWENEESTVVADVPTVVFAAGHGERP